MLNNNTELTNDLECTLEGLGYEECNNWELQLTTDKGGEYQPTTPNLKRILNNDPELKNLGRYDTAKCQRTLSGRVPWSDPSVTDDQEQGRYFDEDDMNYLFEFIQEKYRMVNLKYNILEISVNNYYKAHKYSSIVERLESLVWDGLPRIETVFIQYLGAKDTPYTREVCKLTFCSLVKRAYEPGSKFDYMPILRGDQGLGKSTFLQRIVYWDKDLFSDRVKNVTDQKLILEATLGKWVIEFAEAAIFNKTNPNDLKEYITRGSDEARMAYGKLSKTVPRQYVAIATTNDSSFLKDMTGNRRFLPVECYKPEDGSNPIKRLNKMTDDYIDQVWAEAVHLVKNGIQLTLSDELENYANDIRTIYLCEDTKADNIAIYLDMKLPADWKDKPISERIEYLKNPYSDDLPDMYEREFVCTEEIYKEALGNKDSTPSKYESMQIGEILKNHGWVKTGEKMTVPQYGRKYVYKKR